MFISLPEDYLTESCVNGSVRLIDRETTSEGMLELCLNGQWGTVCNGFFFDLEAHVACRQLGFGSIIIPELRGKSIGMPYCPLH